MTRPATQIYEFGPFRIHAPKRLLLRHGEPVPLTPKAFDVLLALVENNDRMLGKEELLQIVWPDTVVEERNLTVNISTLRKALGEAAAEYRYIVTVPGRGYRFAAAVRKVEDGSDDVAIGRHVQPAVPVEEKAGNETKSDKALQSSAGAATLVASKRAALLSVAIVAVALIVAVFLYSKRARPEQTQPLKQVGALIPIKSIAVLPFKPLVVDSRDESLEMGMADTLIMRLSSLRRIIVRPMNSVRRYAGLEQDPVVAGREQGVEAVIDGSIQKSGERLRVTVRLISTADAQQLWADRFEEKFTDLFSVQDSISERVAVALAIKLTGEEQKQLTKRYTENTEAYHLYLKGRHFASKWTPEGFDKGAEYFNRAVAIDPNYAIAYDGLAYCYYATNWWSPWKESLAKAKALAKKALEIDPTLAEAHTSLGILYTWSDYDWVAAEREFNRALELKPNYAPAHQWYGFLMIPLGRPEESIAEAKRAVEIDPLSAEANTALGVYFFYAHRYDEAMLQLRTTIELEPGYWFAHLYLARVYEQKGELAAAIAELEKTKLMEGSSAEVLSALGYAYAVAGKKVQAREMIVELKEQSRRMYVAPYNIATIYAGLAEKEQAFAYLEKEYKEGAYYMNYLEVDPEFDSLRSDPRFTQLLRSVKHFV
jgi:DNA-binding winged helix-turn-helix (wHTH) protein/TolB-like protein/lipoprotein NlpI